MPLLLRRSAPSPSVDELAFATRAPPRGPSASVLIEASRYSRSLCPVHGSRATMIRRRSGNQATIEDETTGDVSEPTCSCSTAQLRRSSQASSKRLSGKLSESDSLAEADTERETQSTTSSREQGRSNSNCGEEDADTDDAESCCDSLISSASSRVIIRDTQLAVVDHEIRNLRKTFVKSIYARLTQMSKRFGRRGPRQLTAA